MGGSQMGIDSGTNPDSNGNPSTSFSPITQSVDEQQILEEIANTDLPPEVEAFVETYDELVGERDPFLWRWVYTSVQPVTLSRVPDEHEVTTATAKTLGVMFMVTLDDLAEQTHDTRLIREAAKIPLAHNPTSVADLNTDHNHIAFALDVWDAFEDAIMDAPRATEFRPLFEFDMKQVTNGMVYSCLVNDRIEMANLAGGLAYDSHTVFHYVNADIDLMYAPEFNSADLGRVRHVLWGGQQLHRIINWVCTWQRELVKGDFTSGIFALALERGLVDADSLRRVRNGAADAAVIRNVIERSNLEQQLIDQWEQRYTATLKTAREAEAQSVDLVDYVIGVRQVCQHCLAAKGEK